MPSALPDPLPIPPAAGPISAAIRPPGSKSLTNRALLLASLASGRSTLRGALTDADDARVMIDALRALGAGVDIDGTTIHVTGVGGRWWPAVSELRLDLHNAGTATRFLAAAALLAPPGTTVTIDGDERMRERPIGELVEALNALSSPGKCATCTGRSGYPPVRIEPLHPPAASDPATVRFGRTRSSQFISALLLIAPFLPGGLSVAFDDAITSEPYIDMTIGLLRRLGGVVDDRRPAGVRIEHGLIAGFELDIEPDASGATYFEAAAAILPGSTITIEGLDLHPSRPSLQGDTGFVRILTGMGARVERSGRGLVVSAPADGRLRPIDADLSDMPDTAMTAAALACFAAPTQDNPTATTTLRGLRTLRVKETDRIQALRTELGRIGVETAVLSEPDGDEALRITPPAGGLIGDSGPQAPVDVAFDTYNDHRMAMSLALVGLRVPGVKVRNPGCVGKTYPGFWDDLMRLYG